jgi:hypothetical protein
MPLVEYLYRFAGFVAPLNQRLSRYRTNFVIPLNFVLMVGLGFFVLLNVSRLATLARYRQAPEPQSVGTLLSESPSASSYVAVKGRVRRGAGIGVGDLKNGGSVGRTDQGWASLFDPGTGSGILVQLPRDAPFPGSGEDVTVAGMLRPVTPAVLRQLAARNYTFGGIPVDRRLMLVPGVPPGSFTENTLGLVISLALLVGFVWATLTGNVIFKPSDTPGAYVPVQADPAAPLRVSGTLRFDEKTSRFFSNMPVTLVRLDTGDLALVNQIETSSTLMGVWTQKRSGIWSLIIRPGSITAAESGFMYWGTERLRASRFQYLDAATGKMDRAVLATSADQEPMVALQGR